VERGGGRGSNSSSLFCVGAVPIVFLQPSSLFSFPRPEGGRWRRRRRDPFFLLGPVFMSSFFPPLLLIAPNRRKKRRGLKRLYFSLFPFRLPFRPLPSFLLRCLLGGEENKIRRSSFFFFPFPFSSLGCSFAGLFSELREELVKKENSGSSLSFFPPLSSFPLRKILFSSFFPAGNEDRRNTSPPSLPLPSSSGFPLEPFPPPLGLTARRKDRRGRFVLPFIYRVRWRKRRGGSRCFFFLPGLQFCESLSFFFKSKEISLSPLSTSRVVRLFPSPPFFFNTRIDGGERGYRVGGRPGLPLFSRSTGPFSPPFFLSHRRGKREWGSGPGSPFSFVPGGAAKVPHLVDHFGSRRRDQAGGTLPCFRDRPFPPLPQLEQEKRAPVFFFHLESTSLISSFTFSSPRSAARGCEVLLVPCPPFSSLPFPPPNVSFPSFFFHFLRAADQLMVGGVPCFFFSRHEVP